MCVSRLIPFLLLLFIWISTPHPAHLLPVAPPPPSPEMLPQPQRIVNGREVYIYDHPYLVYLSKAATNEILCSGTILNRWSILTAGHCMHKQPIEDVVVVAGYNKEQRNIQSRHVAKVTMHPQFVDTTKDKTVKRKYVDFDFALAHLLKPLQYTLAVQWVVLAKSYQDLKENDELFVMGWGAQKFSPPQNAMKLVTPALMGVPLTLSNFPECRKNYSKINVYVTHNFFCASSKWGGATCHGDSGGPIIRNNLQYGIVSYAAGCYNTGYSSVFAKIPSAYEWLRTTAVGARRWDGNGIIRKWLPLYYLTSRLTLLLQSK